MLHLRITSILLLVTLLTGCGGPAGPERCAVSGAVSFDGEPIESGTITFLPEDGKGVSAGGAIQQGRYSIDAAAGPEIGEHRVEIIGLKSEGTKTVEGVQGSAIGPSGKATVAELKMIVPAEFNTRSTLKVAIKSGPNSHDFTLKQSTANVDQ